MTLGFMGTPDFAVPCLQKLIERGHTLKVVVTQPDRPQGRHSLLVPSPIKKVALEHGIPILQPEKIRGNEAFQQDIRDLSLDCLVVVAYGLILPQSLLDIPRLGCVNVHASLLPKYRGAAPINWAIVNGEAESGVTTMLMDSGMDTGPVLLQRGTPLGARETARSLHDSLSTLGAELLIETFERLESLPPQPQDSALATLAPLMKKEDGLLNFALSAGALDRRIRGFFPWPGSYTFLQGNRVKVLEAWPSAEPTTLPPGTILKDRIDAVWVATGAGLLKMTQLQPEGKAAMTGEAFLRGLRGENWRFNTI